MPFGTAVSFMFSTRRCCFLLLCLLVQAVPLCRLPAQTATNNEPDNLPAGIAVWDDTIYISDADNSEIVIRLPGEEKFETFLKDPRIAAPRGLAVDETYLYIADPLAHQVFRVNRITKDVLPLFPPGTPVAPIDLTSVPSFVESTDKITSYPSLAVLDSATDSTIILTPYNDNKYLESSLGRPFTSASAIARFGARLLVTDPGASALYERSTSGDWQDIRSEQTSRSFASANGLPRATGYFFPSISHPQSATGYGDFVYVVQNNLLYAYLPTQDRLIALEGRTAPPHGFSRVIVSPINDQLYLLGNSFKELTTWPIKLPVAVEVTAGGDLSTPLAALYKYLWDQGSLPTVTVTIPSADGSQVACMTAACLVEHVRLLLPRMNSTMERLLCQMNPGLCSSEVTPRLAPGSSIRLPDAPSEPHLSYEAMVVDGQHSLGAYLDRLIPDPTLRASITSSFIASLNKVPDRDLGTIPPKGESLTLPVQYNRYFLAVDKHELYSRGSALAALLTRYKTLSISPFGATSKPLGDSGVAPEIAKHSISELALLREKAFVNLGYDPRHAIAYGRANLVPVLIDEASLDCQHPVFFGGAQDDRAFTDVECATQKSAQTPTFVDWNMSDSHHGTCVASIVGGRSAPYGQSLAPGAELGHLTIGEMTHENLIGFYRKELQPFVVNISYGDTAVTAENVWQNLISQTLDGQSVLFVAAAGNEAGLLRDKGDYPAILAREFPNVISVGALDKDGQKAWSDSATGEASNTGYKVELMAPGELVPCATDVYQGTALYSAPAGTSFAAPLVSAVAALLLEKRLVPTEVKARLLATADPITEARDGQPLALFGRLNVENALLNPKVYHVIYEASSCLEGSTDESGRCHLDVDLVSPPPTLVSVDPDDALSTPVPVVFSYLLSIRHGSLDPSGKRLFRLVSFTKGNSGANSTIELKRDVRLSGCVKVKSHQTGQTLLLAFGNSCPEAENASDPSTVLSDAYFLIAPTLGAARVGQDHH